MTYTPQQRFTAQDKKAFSNTSLESSLEFSFEQLSISHSPAPLGYMQLRSSGHQQSGQKSEKGTLYLNLISIPPKGEELSPASRILGIACMKPNNTLPGFPTLAAETMRLTTAMGGRIVGHGQACSSEEPIINQDQDSFQAALSVPDGGYALIMKIEDIDYSTIDFTSPTLIVDEKNYPLTHDSSSPTLPESSTLILMYFVPDDQSFHDLHIHMTRASGTASISAGRELTEQDLQHLANLATLDTLVGTIRASGEVTDNQISTIKEQYGANLNEASFQLLKVLLEKKASNMTAEFLAGLLDSENHRVLADRVRSGKLQLTEQDEAFQAEMVTAGTILGAVAPQIAPLMGFNDNDLKAITDDQNPGYRLLYKAYVTGKLHKIYSTCSILGVIDYKRQIEQDSRFPLLAAQLMNLPLSPQKVAASKILRVQFKHLNQDLLRVQLSQNNLENLRSRIPGSLHQSLLNKICLAAGDQYSGNKKWEMLTNATYVTNDYERDKWGQMMPYGKLITLLNKVETLEAASLAQHLVKDIEHGRVERNLTAKDYFVMADYQKDRNPKRAIALLLHIDKKDLKKDLIHPHRIQCEWCNEEIMIQGRRTYRRTCKDWPTLEQKAQEYRITQPARFSHNPK